MCQAKLMQWSKNINPQKIIYEVQAQIMELRSGIQTREAKEKIL